MSFLRCAEPVSNGEKLSVRIPPLTLTEDGLDLKIQGIKSTLVTVGLLAGISEATKPNLALLDYFLARFKEAGVQIVAVVGGVGATEENLDGILRRIAAAPVPILLVPGVEENFDVFRKSVAKYRVQAPQLIDMTRIRRVQVGRMTLVSLPGTRRPYYLSAKERGCGITDADLEMTVDLFNTEGPNVLLSPTPPRGSGALAVDRTRSQVNVGDAVLRRLLAERAVRFGLFGYAYEAGGHATASDGVQPAAPGIWSDSLWIQAGSAAALPMSLTGEGRSAGMAHIVSFSGNRVRYQTVPPPVR